jgi:hypothetical protein
MKGFSSQSFWNVTDVNQLNQDARLNATITELILLIKHSRWYVSIEYTNPSFENDASPSKPVCMPLLI